MGALDNTGPGGFNAQLYAAGEKGLAQETIRALKETLRKPRLIPARLQSLTGLKIIVDLETRHVESIQGRQAVPASFASKQRARFAQASKLVLCWAAAEAVRGFVSRESDAAAAAREWASGAAYPRNPPEEIRVRILFTQATIRKLGELGEYAAPFARDVASRLPGFDKHHSYAQMIERHDEGVQKAAVTALARFGPAAVPFVGLLPQFLECQRPQMRAAALDSLRRLGKHDSLGRLGQHAQGAMSKVVQLLGHKDWWVREVAIEGLQSFGVRAIAPHQAEIARYLSQDLDMRSAASDLCSMLGISLPPVTALPDQEPTSQIQGNARSRRHKQHPPTRSDLDNDWRASAS